MAHQAAQALSITTIHQRATTTRITKITTHSAAHRALEALRVVIQEVACRQAAHMVAVKLEDNYEEDISIFVLGTAAWHNGKGARI